MAASRRGVKFRKLFRRNSFFFYVAGLIIATQLYIGYSFYKLSQEELNSIRRELKTDSRHHNLKDIDGQPNIPRPSINFKDEKKEEEFNGESDQDGMRMRSRIDSILQEAQRDKELPANAIVDIKQQLVQLMSEKKASLKNMGEVLAGLVRKAMGGGEVPDEDPEHAGYTMPCDHVTREAQSALSRAKTPECKQKIADIACASEEKYMFAETLPRYCPLKGNNKGAYVGCFEDSRNARLLGDVKEDFVNDNTVLKCINLCITCGFKFAGLQYGIECWCGDKVKTDKLSDEQKCDKPCPGDKSQMCGGFLYTNVYHTGIGEKPSNVAPYVTVLPANVEPVKIVFVFTVNGRADRQVRRLFKALYHEHHYYYIHVDARQEYLHRELSTLAERFPNVRIATSRLSTIWGGSSLLTMLLNCMRDLLSFEDWQWDYFLNLSESDFPVKPLAELVAYLSTYRDKNFLQGRFSDKPTFIKKQGLDQIFYECDTHMWRLGRKHLPSDVVWSGGSDWICLHKPFCDYVVNSEDELIAGLKHYFAYSLLPAESFFHTALLNSEYCNSFVNNNLHATNWNRKQGCKCQYKHVVDWCGCSPNDYLPRDLNKLQMTSRSPVYFARKFEHIISTSIITAVELMAVPEIDPDQQIKGLQSHWQNEFHHLDAETKVAESSFTYYHSFGRNALKFIAQHSKCSFSFEKLLESHVYSYADKIQGLLVLFEASYNGVWYEVEALLQRPDTFRPGNAVGEASRLAYVDVGSLWDPKEETFRNYGRLLGPNDDISVALWCKQGDEVTFSVVYIDPAHVIAASYDIIVKRDQHVALHKPDFYKPLRPGKWTIRVLYAWESIAETKFHVTPLSHVDGVPVTSSQAKQLHSGPGRLYVDKNFKEFNDILKLSNSAKLMKEADQNALRKGKNLLEWIDELSSRLYQIAESCIVGQVLLNCAEIPKCEQTKWSSRSPDPKSEIGEVDPLTHMMKR